MKLLGPAHIHVMEKIRGGQAVFHKDVERKLLKDLLKWELLKKVGSDGTLALTRLGDGLLTCYSEASKAMRPKLHSHVEGVMPEG
ncbi:hypothetical protein HRbin02_01077 [Candidatus Calditenuaceae archaeon HR02]|nr:hypothetical protein HRbin02_01077 [Candidatus Calditenuaceae archaeon HR02]